ncbi:hypothetical protein, partial [Lacticaseibacillus rhamnosus]|uniref:hypothetical protein n=1 Tax=Lacticaseibacillus rhamnosus TaxID=47715 RepID=UPI003EC0BB35
MSIHVHKKYMRIFLILLKEAGTLLFRKHFHYSAGAHSAPMGECFTYLKSASASGLGFPGVMPICLLYTRVPPHAKKRCGRPEQPPVVIS